MNKKQALLGSALVFGALSVLSVAPASASSIKIYGKVSTPTITYSCVDNPVSKPCTTATSSTTSIYKGTNQPGITWPGLAQSFNKTFYSYTPVGKDGTTQQTLFSVNPKSCLKGSGYSCDMKGTTNYLEKVDIKTGFTFSLTSGGPGITIWDTALATFNYKNETDNFCWDDSKVSYSLSAGFTDAKLVSHKSVGLCHAAGSDLPNDGFEEIIFKLGGNYFELNLYNWNDWNMTPQISFSWLDPTKVPEPASVTLLGAGLVGLGRLIRRRKKAA